MTKINHLLLKIVSLENSQTLEVEWVEIEAPNGSFVICPGHINLASRLKSGGEISFKNPSGAIATLKATGGFMTVNDGKFVTLIILNN